VAAIKTKLTPAAKLSDIRGPAQIIESLSYYVTDINVEECCLSSPAPLGAPWPEESLEIAVDLLPTWTKAGSWTLGRDPLGVQATSVRMYRNLIPGLTNVTNRLRYYSFYCWVIERYEATEHSGDEKRWGMFIRRAEALYALACNLVDLEQADGLAGNIWARRIQKAIQDGIFDVRPATDFHPGAEQYLSARRGNFGQFYIASMTEEKFLAPSFGIPIVSEKLGRKAAEAFRTSVGNAADKLVDAIRDGVLLIDDLKEIGLAVHPSKIPQDSEEMTLLRAFLLAEGNETSNGKARRASSWLLLDLFGKGVSADDENAIRRAFYNRTLTDGSAYSPPGQTVELWRAYQANEFCHIALEAVLNALVARLQRKPSGEDPDTLIAETIEPALANLDADEHSWEDWAIKIGVSNVGNEEDLAQPVLRALQDERLAEDCTALESALALLAVLWTRWGSSDAGVREAIDRYAAIGGRSLGGIIRTLDTQATAPTFTAITQAIRRHVVSDHLAIADRKLAASGTFTYHFTSADGVLADGRIATYGYTNPRLRNLVRFLKDAGLYDYSGVTPIGKSFLNDCEPV
jgi:hypothetical protein